MFSQHPVLDSLVFAALAFLINLPVTYRFTSGLLGDKIFGVPLSVNGCPTWKAVALHAVVLFLLFLLVIWIASLIDKSKR